MDKKNVNEMSVDELDTEIEVLESRLDELQARKTEISDPEPAEIKSTGGCMSVEFR